MKIFGWVCYNCGHKFRSVESLTEGEILRPDRLLLYWTGEAKRSKALMEFEYDPADVAGAVAHFDDVVAEVQAQRFDVVTPPDKGVCKECDFRSYCVSQGTISPKAIT